MQTALIANRRPDRHRNLGIAGAGPALVMVVLGVAAAVHAIRSSHAPPGLDPRSFLAPPFFDITVFAILAGFALVFRRRAQTHKRLPRLAGIALLDAAIARRPGVFVAGPLAAFGLQDPFVIVAIANDFLSRRRMRPACRFGGLFLPAAQPLRIVVSTAPCWLAFGGWIKG